MCALGNKKNVLSLILTAAWSSDSVLRGHSAFPLPLLLWDSFLSPTLCLHFCRSLGFEPQGLIYPVKVLSFNYELELPGFFLPKGKDAPSQRSECLGLRKTSCVKRISSNDFQSTCLHDGSRTKGIEELCDSILSAPDRNESTMSLGSGISLIRVHILSLPLTACT